MAIYGLKSRVWVSSVEQIPKGEHWAIVRTASVFIEGDERSRTAPGHGYPAHTDNYIEYEAYTDKSEFEQAVKDAAKERCGKSFRVLHIQPLSIETSVTVTISQEAQKGEDANG